MKKSSIFSPYFERMTYAITDRHGGISRSPYNTMNVAYHVGDSHHDVKQNQALLRKALGIEHAQLVYMKQIHSNNVVVVDESFDFTKTPQCDALITEKRDVALMVMVADCNPILIYDPINKISAAVHAGRAGVFTKIVTNTINQMVKMGSEPKVLKVLIGPSIRSCCYEVQNDVINDAVEKNFTQGIVRREYKAYLDLIMLLNDELKINGILKKNIEIYEECTACNTDTFFSYRREQQTGRFAAIIMNN